MIQPEFWFFSSLPEFFFRVFLFPMSAKSSIILLFHHSSSGFPRIDLSYTPCTLEIVALCLRYEESHCPGWWMKFRFSRNSLSNDFVHLAVAPVSIFSWSHILLDNIFMFTIKIRIQLIRKERSWRIFLFDRTKRQRRKFSGKSNWSAKGSRNWKHEEFRAKN